VIAERDLAGVRAVENLQLDLRHEY